MVNEIDEQTQGQMVDEGDEGEGTVELTDEQRRQLEQLQNRNVAVLTVMMPPPMRELLNERAKEDGDKSAATFAREIIANALGYTLPTESRTRARKYATEEERIAANKAKAKERREQVNELLAALKSGKVSL